MSAVQHDHHRKLTRNLSWTKHWSYATHDDGTCSLVRLCRELRARAASLHRLSALVAVVQTQARQRGDSRVLATDLHDLHVRVQRREHHRTKGPQSARLEGARTRARSA